MKLLNHLAGLLLRVDLRSSMAFVVWVCAQGTRQAGGWRDDRQGCAFTAELKLCAIHLQALQLAWLWG